MADAGDVEHVFRLYHRGLSEHIISNLILHFNERLSWDEIWCVHTQIYQLFVVSWYERNCIELGEWDTVCPIDNFQISDMEREYQCTLRAMCADKYQYAKSNANRTLAPVLKTTNKEQLREYYAVIDNIHREYLHVVRFLTELEWPEIGLVLQARNLSKDADKKDELKDSLWLRYLAFCAENGIKHLRLRETKKEKEEEVRKTPLSFQEVIHKFKDILFTIESHYDHKKVYRPI